MPAWPILAGFGGFPLWWLAGLVDVMWVVLAGVMLLYLHRSRGVQAPVGFGLWLIFLALVVFSAINLETLGQAAAFTYRLTQLVAAGVIALYIYNARERITPRLLAGGLTCLWLTTVVGGYLGVIWPFGAYHSPLSYVVPQGLLANDLVNHMVIRQYAQGGEGYFELSPRPSAPFRYTNNWGNVFSLLFPFVIVYVAMVRRTRRFWLLAVCILLSLVPAFLTLNRGMFIGLALTMVYGAVRLALRGQAKALVGVVTVGAVAGVVFLALPITERLDQRLEGSSTTDNRAAIYAQAIEAAKESPFIGHGAPQDAENPHGPPVGTHGEMWTVLVLFGPFGVLCYVGWFALAYLLSLRRREPMAFGANVVLLVGLVELTFYGMITYGLPIMMAAAAIALRPNDPDPRSAVSTPA